MRLSYLQEFVEVSRTLNFNEAAHGLHISQSTLSKHIQALESDLQAVLLERDRHHVMLTSQGEVLLDCAKLICRSYADVKDAFALEAQNRCRLFVGGLIDSPGEFSWLSKASNAIQIRRPSFSPHFIPVSAASPITQVVNGDIDCAIIAFDPADYDVRVTEELVSEPVARSPFIAVVASNSPLADKGRLTAEDLQGSTFIRMMGPRMTSGWRVVQQMLERNRISFETKQVTILSVYDYVGIGLDNEVLLLPKCEVRKQEARSSERRMLALDISDAYTPLSVVYRKDRPSTVLREFIDELKSTPL